MNFSTSKLYCDLKQLINQTIDTKLACILTLSEEKLLEKSEKEKCDAETQTEGSTTYGGDHCYTEDASSLGITYMLVDDQNVCGADQMDILDTIVGHSTVSTEPPVASTLDEYNRLDL